ncbi:ABC transporter ATP-binding protein [Aquamicrobium defluvii]|uniref:ABC transporter n=1 Tax=Aquamicrobium defluvii TaxID=69279 RepID=A0A011U8P2_9HYPH|nr:ABC transporter ATP-binding protein [Aquamicrobium defluvii]EXL02228.1 ABC transporter [Aquamicrobium defluvii]EZQ12970.1 ABC transporter [Halopseudomonas bauzanensis]
MKPVVSVQNLRVVSSAGAVVLNDASVDVFPGEVVALIGESGSGKTTLSLAALGHFRPGLRPVGGSVDLSGVDMLAASPRVLSQLRGPQVSYVAQSAAAAFNPSFRLKKQVVESSIVHQTLTAVEADKRAMDLFGLMELPDARRIGQRFPHQVSGGQLQRFMAAMGLMESPKLVVFDEPTSALDVTTQVEVLKVFKAAVANSDRAALFVSHDLAVVAQIADRIVVMRHGHVIETGTTSAILETPQESYTKQLVGAYRNWEVAATGSSVAPPAGRQLLSATDINVTFGQVKAVSNVQLNLNQGEILAVIGESGSGKSTLAQVLSGTQPLFSGSLLLDGAKLAPVAAQRSAMERRKVQIVFQMADTALNPRHKIRTILGRVLAFFGNVPKSRRDARIAELLAMVQLPAAYADRRPGQLSGGEKQRVNIARALAADPEIVICDEITSALDTVVVAEIVALIKELRERNGLSFLFISHDMATVAGIADRVVVMKRGEIVDQGVVSDVLFRPTNAYTRLLINSIPALRQGWLEEAVEKRASLIAG